MLKFKLDKLMATSLIALAMSSNSIDAGQRSRLGQGETQPTASTQDLTTLPIPRYRFEGAKTYNALKAKADSGDEVAKKVLENYNGSALSTDLNAAKNAAIAYNNKNLTPPKEGVPTSVTRTAPVITPSPRSTVPTQGMGAVPSRVKLTSSSDAKAEVVVPKNGFDAIRLYSALKEKADKGDKAAEQVLNKYKSSDFQRLNLAVEAATTYNNSLKGAAEKEILSEVPALKAELASAEAQVPAKLGTSAGKNVEKIKEIAERCINDFGKEEAKYKEKIKALENELKQAKHCPTGAIGASKEKRDFVKEMEELVHKMSTSNDPKELELLNLKIGQLERESSEAGVVLGEAAEKKAAAEEAQKLKEQQQQARQALKKIEEDKDIQAYETKGAWLPTLATSKVLADYLNHNENDLFANFVNATISLKIGGLIEQEGNENVLRALRHMVHKFQAKGNLSQKQKDELSVLANKIDLRLGSLGVKNQSQTEQASSFTASPEEKRSYETFQFVWGEAQKDPSSKLFKSINNIRNTDALITLITSPQDSLSNITFDAVKLRSISFSKATLLELKAFKYALSQARTSSFNPTAARNLTQTIDENIRNLQQGNVPKNLEERTNDEQKMASRIKVTPAQRSQMLEEQKQADKAKVNKLIPNESAEVKDYIFDQMFKNKVKIGELTNEQLKASVEQFKEAFERSKGEEALFTIVSGVLPDMAEKDRRDVLKKLLNLNFDFRTANTPEGQAKIKAEAKKITDLNERRKSMAAKTATKAAGPALSPGDSILVRKHLKALHPEKSPQEINNLFNKVATDILAKGLTGAAITEEEVKARAE